MRGHSISEQQLLMTPGTPEDPCRGPQLTGSSQLATRNFSKAGDKMTFSAVFVLATAVHPWNG